jgi:hypothetical protein
MYIFFRVCPFLQWRHLDAPVFWDANVLGRSSSTTEETVDGSESVQNVQNVVTAVLQVLDQALSPTRSASLHAVDSMADSDECWLFSSAEVLETYLTSFVAAYSTLYPALTTGFERYLVLNLDKDGSVFFSAQDAPSPCIDPSVIIGESRIRKRLENRKWFHGPIQSPVIQIPRVPGFEFGYNPTMDTDLELNWYRQQRTTINPGRALAPVCDMEPAQEELQQRLNDWIHRPIEIENVERVRSPSVESITERCRDSSATPPPTKRVKRRERPVGVDTIELLGLKEMEPYHLPNGPSGQKIFDIIKHLHEKLRHVDGGPRKPGRPSKVERIDFAQRREALRVTSLVIAEPLYANVYKPRYTLSDGTEFRLPSTELFQCNGFLSQLVQDACKKVGVDIPQNWLDQSKKAIAQGPRIDALPLEKYTVNVQRNRRDKPTRKRDRELSD